MHAARAYTIAVGMVFVLLAGRLALRPWVGDTATYLPFFPAILIASWYGGFGPGSLATGLSSIAVMYFLSPGGFGVGGTGGAISLAFFIATGLSIAWLTEQLHAAAAASAARAERLNAIINTTVDGILVINEQGRIEAFNRGAERLFGYPESEVLGRNVSVLMPSPYHEEHDRYLERYLTTGDAKVIGKGREVSGRRRDGTIFHYIFRSERWLSMDSASSPACSMTCPSARG